MKIKFSSFKSVFILLIVSFLIYIIFNKINDNVELMKGRNLANQYCSSCHLPVSPNILPKQSWESVLGYMGYWLGIEDISYLSDHPEFARINVSARQEILKREGVFPDHQLISDEDWRLIRNYFVFLCPQF